MNSVPAEAGRIMVTMLTDKDKQVLKQHGYESIRQYREAIRVDKLACEPWNRKYELLGRIVWFEVDDIQHPEGVPVIDLRRHEQKFNVKLQIDEALYELSRQVIGDLKDEIVRKSDIQAEP